MPTLLVPEFRSGRGTGHLIRAGRVAADFDDAVIALTAALSGDHGFAEELSAEDAEAGRAAQELLRGRGVDAPITIGTECPTGPVDRVIVDVPWMPAATLSRLPEAGIYVGIDLGGSARGRFPYLIDTLPRLDDHPPNISDATLLDLPSREKQNAARVPGRVLITFGGEDSARLTEICAAALARIAEHCRIAFAQPIDEILVVRPANREVVSLPSRCRLVEPGNAFWQLLATTDLCVTQFGLTAYEARALECRTVTVAPTPYHDRLAAHAGFSRWRPARSLRASAERLSRALLRADAPIVERGETRLSERIRALRPPPRAECPLRGDRARVVHRSPRRTYFSCAPSGLRYMQRYTPQSISYDKAYFEKEYVAQYGRTYLEDFEHIARMGERRLATISRVTSGTLLDLGCAYGPFLAAASRAGFQPHGVDISEDAVRYVRSKLGHPAVVSDLLELDVVSGFGRERFDVVTLWYVIEHIVKLEALLEKLALLVRPGGVLALSTPNADGVSARRAPHDFYANSPEDHVTLWTPRSARRVLERFGFDVFQIRVTGHHPERYPAVAGGRIPRFLAALHSRAAGWGDTFETYARRIV